VGHKEVPVTQLRKKVLEELERRNYSQATARAYVGAIRRFAEHFHRSPDQLGIEHVRQYQLHLVQERKLQPRTVMIQMAALRFLFLKTLKRRYSRDDLPLPKTPRRQLPTVLSREEVAKLIESTSNLRQSHDLDDALRHRGAPRRIVPPQAGGYRQPTHGDSLHIIQGCDWHIFSAPAPYSG